MKEQKDGLIKKEKISQKKPRGENKESMIPKGTTEKASGPYKFKY